MPERDENTEAVPLPPAKNLGSGGSDGGNEKPRTVPPAEIIPPDAPFIYIDPEKKKKVILVTPTSSVTKKEFDRIKAWFDLQFFIADDGDQK